MTVTGSNLKVTEDIMHDEIDGRLWAQHHQDFSEMVHRAADQVRTALNLLHHIQFDAPWKKRPRHSS